MKWFKRQFHTIVACSIVFFSFIVCSTSQHTSALPKNDGRTRSAKRKAGPEKNTVQKKGKVSEVPEPRDKDRVTSEKKKGREDEEGLSEKTKKRWRLNLNSYNKKSALTSVGTGRGGLIIFSLIKARKTWVLAC